MLKLRGGTKGGYILNNFFPDNSNDFSLQYRNEKIFLEQLRLENDVRLDAAKTFHQMMCNEQKAAYEEEKDLRRFKLQKELIENRELSQKVLDVDLHGYLCIERINPEGEKKMSQPISNAHHFRSSILSSGNKEKCKDLKPVLMVSWYGDDVGVLLPLDGNDASARKLLKKFQERGVSFRFPRRDSNVLCDYFLSWLIENAENVKIPERLGWNQLENGAWCFEKNPCKTLEGVNENE